MSTFLRVLVMALAWFVFFLTSFYGCIRPEYAGGVARAPEASAPVSPRPSPAPAPRLDTLRVNSGGDAGAEAEIIQLSETQYKIRFPFNSERETIAPEVEDYLGRLARRLSSSSGRLTVVGHTDDVGSEAANQDLGLRRAEFVKNILVRQGAPAERIYTSSRGESEPEAPNATAEGQRINRRAVITLEDASTPPNS